MILTELPNQNGIAWLPLKLCKIWEIQGELLNKIISVLNWPEYEIGFSAELQSWTSWIFYILIIFKGNCSSEKLTHGSLVNTCNCGEFEQLNYAQDGTQ